MRIDTVFKYHFAFEYWILAANTDGTTDYKKSYDANGMMIPGQANSLYLITKDQMQIPMQVRNLRDRSGAVVTAIGGQSYPMYVHAAEPQLDPFSNVIAWRHTLKREVPRDYTALIQDVVDRASV